MVELARRISDRSIQLLEMVVKEMTTFRDIRPSRLASAIVYISRQEESANMKLQSYGGWCRELEIMTEHT